uniref:Uncharacterized protein n=1 Tax=Chrysotila carterae TaxID=13221 RepID=A0A7S4BUZ2_CHRCT
MLSADFCRWKTDAQSIAVLLIRRSCVRHRQACEKGRTALHSCARAGHSGCLALLLHRVVNSERSVGAATECAVKCCASTENSCRQCDLDARDVDGLTPLLTGAW